MRESMGSRMSTGKDDIKSSPTSRFVLANSGCMRFVLALRLCLPSSERLYLNISR